MAGKSNNDQTFSLLAGFGGSDRFLIISLASIVLLIALARGYLFLQFRNQVLNTVTELSKSSVRTSLILSTYQLALESYSLTEQVVQKPADRVVLKRSYLQKTDSLKSARDQYLALLAPIPEKPVEMTSTVRRYFMRLDTLLSKSDQLFESSSSPSHQLQLAEKAESLFKPGIMDYVRRIRRDWEALTQLELELDSKESSQQEQVIRLETEQWFGFSGVLFVVAIALAVAVIILAGRATSLLRQLSTVLEHNVNPIEIADASGKILSVNSEFERWSGVKEVDLVGTKCFDGLRVLNGQEQTPPLWDVVQSSFENGETWAGEVEVRFRNGTVSASSLIALPVFNRQGRLQQVVGLLHDASEKKRLEQKVEDTRRQYQSLIESSPDGIVVVQDEKLVFVNPAIVRILQYESKEDMERLSFVDTIAPASRPFLDIDYRSRPVGEEILKNYEMKGLTKHGKLIDLEINARVINWNGKAALHTSFRDVSERKALERQQAVWLWEQETLSSIDRQLRGIFDLQEVLDIILQQVMLLTRAHFVGIAMIDVENQQAHWRVTKGNRSPHVSDFFKFNPELSSFLDKLEHVVVEDRRVPTSFRIAEFPPLESEGIVAVGFFPLMVNNKSRGRLVIGFRQPHRFQEREVRVLDSIAEKTSIALTSGELYEDLVHRERELEALSGARVQAQEDERRRISREIHDGLGQLLTAMKFNLEILEDSLPVHEETEKRIADIKELLENVMKEAREISYNLMPSVLDDFGLAPGLLSLCEQFSKGTGIKATFHEHGLKERLNADMEIGLYRVVQEALNNIAKHADAKEVEVQIVRHSEVLRLTVEDDGRGMAGHRPVRRSIRSGGMGLVSMRERAASLNGTLVIDSTPGKGTLINIEITLKAD